MSAELRCPHCSGSGSHGRRSGDRCGACGGTGFVRAGIPAVDQVHVLLDGVSRCLADVDSVHSHLRSLLRCLDDMGVPDVDVATAVGLTVPQISSLRA